ncbi:MAG: T9SS type A sorting domain-containing protein [Bacteroidales bacterium]|nr:T9SS type A sorting domain-containing protein [Bacteroidales bacterium]
MKTLKSITEKDMDPKGLCQSVFLTRLGFFINLSFLIFFFINADLKAQPDKIGINFKISDYDNASAKTDPFSVFAVMYMKQSSGGSDLTVTNCDDTGPGSLREAINYANSNPGHDTIRFNIPKGVPGYDADIGVWMIAPQSELPTITESLYIEGFSQQAFMGEDSNPFGPEIWLYGEIAGQGNCGLVSTADGTDIAGLIISNFQNAGLLFYGVDGGSISGCYVGVDFSGNAAVGNVYGIWLTHHTRNIEISPFDTLKNIISGNMYEGIVVADTSGNISILGNIIGLNRTGTATIGNQGQGISVFTACDSVDVYDNWIGGNESGLYIMGSYNSVRNNFIGSRKVNNEILELGNEFNGINLHGDAHDNLITENFIRFNGNCGVYIEGVNAINNKVSQNHISGSGSGYGIYNTSGGNKELSPPEITEATSSSVTGTAISNATVEIYTDPGSEGLMFQGEVNADAGGIFTWNGTIAGAFTNVTAVAIDDDGNTSMFSDAAVIGSTTKEELTVVNCDDSGPGSLRNAIIYANSNPGADTIRFNIPKGVAGFDTILGVCTIEPQSGLPDITESLFIDGFSQKAFTGEDSNPLGPEIWLNGEMAGDYAYGLKCKAAGTDIAGLAIGNFHTGIFMEGVDGGSVSGCYIGVDFTGDTAAANVYGIILSHHTCNITIAPYDTFPNVVSGNTHGGIMISDTSDHIIVTGNLVGLNRTGMFTIGNENNAGIRIGTECDSVEVFDNRIGGNQTGITIWGSFNTIHHNIIGLNDTGSELLDLGNEDSGIHLSEGAQNNLITNNFICFNSIHGVTVNGANTLYNKVSHNQISENGWGYGIYNYSGGNNELAPPVISAATSSSVTGTAIPDATVEIYTDPKNEGLIFQGEVKADANGNFIWNGIITGTYANVTAIAIDDNGNTSMFSDAVTIDGMVDIEDLYRNSYHTLFLSYPNPYYQGATIRFTIPDDCMVTLQIYDLMGREVDILVHENKSAGEYSIEWARSADYATGIYLVTLQAGGSVKTTKLILQK